MAETPTTPTLTVGATGRNSATIEGSALAQQYYPASSYETTVVADGPGLFYRFEDAVGSTEVLDHSGNSRNGTVEGAFTFRAAGLLPGSPYAATAPLAASAGITYPGEAWRDGDFGSLLIVEMWINLPDVVTNQNLFFIDGEIQCYVENSKVKLNPYLSNFNSITESTIDIEANTSYHLVFYKRRNNSSSRGMYINGVARGGSVTGGASGLGGTLNPNIIGGGVLGGRIDEVAVYAKPSTFAASLGTMAATHYTASAESAQLTEVPAGSHGASQWLLYANGTEIQDTGIDTVNLEEITFEDLDIRLDKVTVLDAVWNQLDITDVAFTTKVRYRGRDDVWSAYSDTVEFSFDNWFSVGL